MGKVTKHQKRKRNKFKILRENNKFSLQGRPTFTSLAKKIKVNQDPAKGPIEDRRHILHYHEVLKPNIERVLSRLYDAEGQSTSGIVKVIREALARKKIKRLPRNDEELLKRFVVEMNSATTNLVPGNADTNKAIELVRGELRDCLKCLGEDYPSESVRSNDGRVDFYKSRIKAILQKASSGTDIGKERKRINGMILEDIDAFSSPAQLTGYIVDAIHSVTFDYSPEIKRSMTVKAIEWQRRMAANERASAKQQLTDLLGLI